MLNITIDPQKCIPVPTIACHQPPAPPSQQQSIAPAHPSSLLVCAAWQPAFPPVFGARNYIMVPAKEPCNELRSNGKSSGEELHRILSHITSLTLAQHTTHWQNCTMSHRGTVVWSFVNPPPRCPLFLCLTWSGAPASLTYKPQSMRHEPAERG